jgi:hypothetical protein
VCTFRRMGELHNVRVIVVLGVRALKIPELGRRRDRPGFPARRCAWRGIARVLLNDIS